MCNRCIYSVGVVHAKLSLYVTAYLNLYNDSNDLCLVIRTDFSLNTKTFWSKTVSLYILVVLPIYKVTRLADIGGGCAPL